MSTDETRKKLLGEFAVALVAEHAAWNQLRDPELSETARLDSVANWKTAKARLKLLSQQVRAGEVQGIELRTAPVRQRVEAAPAPRNGLAWGRLMVALTIAFTAHCRDAIRSAAARFVASASRARS